jgi:zona occludens toxin
MINGLEGIPGSGKSYEAVVYHVLEALKRGRLVVTNLPLIVPMFAAIDPRYVDLIELRSRPKPVLGTWDANRVDDKGNGNAFALWTKEEEEEASSGRGALVLDGGQVRLGRQVSESVAVFGHVWDYYHEWKHPDTGQGPLYVIDECHVALPKVGTDAQVIQWFKLHRHFNADVLLMTQNFRDMCGPIANLLGMLVRCRKADFLGKPNRYVRKVFAGFRGAEVSRDEREYLAQYFPLYKSHTQGNSVAEAGASDVQPFIVKWKRFTWAYAVCSVLLVAWLFWPSDKPKKAAQGKPAAVAAAPAASAAVVPASAASAPNAAASGPTAATEDPDPLADKGVHLKGRMVLGDRTVYLLAVSQNGQPLHLTTDVQLREAGYVFRPMGECLGALQWKGTVRPLSCDLPAVQVTATPKG